MKKLISSTLALVITIGVTHAAAPDESTIITLENAIWRSVQQKNVEQFKQLVSQNVRAVFADGIMSRPDELKEIPKGAMKSVSLSDFKVTFPDAQTAIVAYVAKVETISGGKNAFTTCNAGSVWRLSKGKWQAIFHGEAKQASAK
ncbi:MAG: nuclear transport factor 2 family protein [Chthoniobacterales bacterium]